MQLVLADTLVDLGRNVETVHDLTVDEGCIRKCLLACKQGRALNEEERARKKLVTEIGEDVGGPLLINVKHMPRTYSCGYEDLKISVTPSSPGKSIFKGLVEKFQEKVQVSLCLKWNVDSKKIVMDFASVKGMKIHPQTFTCVGNGSILSSTYFVPYLDPIAKMHVKLVADIDIPLNTTKQVPFAQKALEEGTRGDLTLSAGNGVKIKAHSDFICACSPLLKVMLEESPTDEIVMSDLSEAGVRAFLRYVYFGDLQGPLDDTRVAYELFYAGHVYKVPDLADEMKDLLVEATMGRINVELAFEIYMFTRTIASAVELKRKALKILSTQGYDESDLELEADMEMCLTEGSDENVDTYVAFRIYMFSMHIESAVKLKTKAIQVLSKEANIPNLESMIDAFMTVKNDEDIDVSVALTMYLFSRKIESANGFKRMALRILKAKWDELESLQEYKDIFEKSGNCKTAMDLCRDLAKNAECIKDDTDTTSAYLFSE